MYLTRGDRVEVLNTITGRVFHSIGGTSGTRAVVLAQDLGRGDTTNGRTNSITVFDCASLAVVGEVPIPGEVPDAMVYEPRQRRLYAFNARSHDAVVLDAATPTVIATLPLPGKPEFAAIDGLGHVYVNLETAEGPLLRIDAAGPSIGATWPMAGCTTPTGLALDRERRRAYSTCANHVLAVTDLDDGHAVARVPIGEHPDAVENDPGRHLVPSSNGGGTLSVLRQESADAYRSVAAAPTQAGARTMALDGDSGRVYLVTAEFGPAAGADRRAAPPAARAATRHLHGARGHAVLSPPLARWRAADAQCTAAAGSRPHGDGTDDDPGTASQHRGDRRPAAYAAHRRHARGAREAPALALGRQSRRVPRQPPHPGDPRLQGSLLRDRPAPSHARAARRGRGRHRDHGRRRPPATRQARVLDVPRQPRLAASI
jgi:YVTN family beta-propeller protein